jgi:hypothetical protein
LANRQGFGRKKPSISGCKFFGDGVPAFSAARSGALNYHGVIYSKKSFEKTWFLKKSLCSFLC